MPQMKPLSGLCILLAMASLPACGGPTYVVEAYSGPRRSATDVAILRFGGSDEARLVVVDGERADVNIAEDARLHVEVLPGEHRLGVISRSDPHGPLQRLLFVAQAGRVYRVIYERGTAKVYEVNGESDAPLREVTRPEPPEPGPLVRPPPPPPEALAPEPEPEPSPDAAAPIEADAGTDGAT